MRTHAVGLRLVPALACLLLAATALRAESDRVMVGEDIFVAEGEALGDVVCVGCSIHVEGSVHDAVAIGGSIEMAGSAEDVVAIGGGIKIAGIAKDVVSVGGSVSLEPGAAVDGDAVSVGGSVHAPEAGAIRGKIVSTASLVPMAFSGLVIALVIALLVALVVQPLLVLACYVILGAARLGVLADTAQQRAGMSFVLGLGLCIGLLVLNILLAFLPIPGPGLHAPLSLAAFVVLTVGYAGVSYWVGRSMLPRLGAGGAAVLGAILVTFLQWIPLIGTIAFVIFAPMAFGAAVLSGFGTSVDWLTQRSNSERHVTV